MTDFMYHALASNSHVIAEKIMQKHGKTFALAAKLLTPASRSDATELYAFARTVDDWIDLQATNHSAQAKIVALQKAFSLHDTNTFGHIQTILKNYAIPNEVMHAFLQAQLHDEDCQHIATQQALIDYAYGVAGSIGRLMRPILGAPMAAEMCATSLGIAMQLTNIARDVVEDAGRMRIYVPATFFSLDANIAIQNIALKNLAPIKIYPQNIKHPTKQEAEIIFAAIKKLLLLADQYYAFAQSGYQTIPLRNRLSIAAAGAMYCAIGKKIIARGCQKYWRGRVSINGIHKAAIGLTAIIATLFNSIFKSEKKFHNAIFNHHAANNNATIIASIEYAIAYYQHK